MKTKPTAPGTTLSYAQTGGTGGLYERNPKTATFYFLQIITFYHGLFYTNSN